MTYRLKLRDPRWQKLRLKVLERDEWRCQGQACASRSNPRVMLVVHHKSYIPGHEPWDYAPEDLTTLCEKCRDSVHDQDAPEGQSALVRGNFYHWSEIGRLVGHEPHGYLTEVAGKIVCGCFRLDLNPDAPGIVLPGGSNPEWVEKAHRFQRQGTAVPVFIKAEGLPWEYVGQFRVEAITENPVEIQIHRERDHLDDIGAAIFLREG